MADDVKAYGYPCWMDMHTSDMKKSLAFYDALLGWKPVGDVDDSYTIIGPDGVGVAGLTADANFPGDLKDDWRLYFRVENAQDTLEHAVDEGGKVLMEVTDMGDSGKSAAVLDPRENVFWLWEAKSFPGYRLMNEDYKPCWTELSVFSIEKATKYYGDVLGLRMSQERTADEVYDDDTGYRILYVGDDAVADVMDADSKYRKDVPKGWTLYIQVPKLDESLAKAVELGGKVIHDPIDTPWGRWAIFTDPTGADVAIIEHGENSLRP